MVCIGILASVEPSHAHAGHRNITMSEPRLYLGEFRACVFQRVGEGVADRTGTRAKRRAKGIPMKRASPLTTILTTTCGNTGRHKTTTCAHKPRTIWL
jgi:hypothetical protein